MPQSLDCGALQDGVLRRGHQSVVLLVGEKRCTCRHVFKCRCGTLVAFFLTRTVNTVLSSCVYSLTFSCLLGESKRRTLPLWLREELEKLEIKKQKEEEKAKREGGRGEREEGQPKWREELEDEEEEKRERELRGKWEREEERRERERRGKWEEEEVEEMPPRAPVRSYRHQSRSRSRSKVSRTQCSTVVENVSCWEIFTCLISC